MSRLESRRKSIIAANKRLCLQNYIDNLLKKQREDPDYIKWDVTKPLPKLPVPSLKQSMEKYLRCIMPIVSDQVYENTERIVNEFLIEDGVGEKLQQILMQTADEKDNWAYEWWLNDMYLLNKLPLPINSNPAMVFPKENFNDEDDQLRFTAKLISGIMDYKCVIDQ